MKDVNCPRCLQPLPGRVARCPGCGQPIQNSSLVLRLIIGVAGFLALIFVVVVMYQTARNEAAAQNAVPVEDVAKSPEEELFPPPAPAGTKEAPKPEKRPPLNER